MASRLNNLTAAFSNVKIRTIMILTAAIMLLVIVVGVIGFHRSNQSANTSQLTKASNLQSIPGLKATSTQYAQIQQDVNQQNYQQAAATHGTAIPTIINQQGLSSSNNPSAYNLNNGAGNTNATNGESGSGKGTGSGTGTNGNANSSGMTAAQLKALEAQQKAQMDAMQKKLDELSSQQAQQQLQQTQGDMQKEAQQLLTAWNGSSNNPTQSFVQGKLATTSSKVTKSSSETSTATASIRGAPGSSMYNSDVIIKAGTILFGVLSTAVNSDEPGPVMATIVTGQLKGSKLIGAIQNSPPIPGSGGATKLILNFTSMSVPYLPESISISAVAVDPDTARTALGSEVDHHYLERYGSLFASAFLEGWGQEISSAGTTVTVSPFGGTTSTKNGTGTTQTVVVNPDGTTTTTSTSPPTNSQGGTLGIGQNVAAGLGQVGTNWGQQLGDTFNRPNTVIINSGVSIGLLFLSDVSASGGNTPVATAPATAITTASTTTTGGTASNTNTATGITTTSTTPMPVPVPTQ
ncbi:MAG: hypothetical protein HKM04_03215 [Legionellales bacterium]|nr:hypothetical protein [Legionellales bacterium]